MPAARLLRASHLRRPSQSTAVAAAEAAAVAAGTMMVQPLLHTLLQLRHWRLWRRPCRRGQDQCFCGGSSGGRHLRLAAASSRGSLLLPYRSRLQQSGPGACGIVRVKLHALQSFCRCPANPVARLHSIQLLYAVLKPPHCIITQAKPSGLQGCGARCGRARGQGATCRLWPQQQAACSIGCSRC
jgi:hypothetical protein